MRCVFDHSDPFLFLIPNFGVEYTLHDGNSASDIVLDPVCFASGRNNVVEGLLIHVVPIGKPISRLLFVFQRWFPGEGLFDDIGDCIDNTTHIEIVKFPIRAFGTELFDVCISESDLAEGPLCQFGLIKFIGPHKLHLCAG